VNYDKIKVELEHLRGLFADEHSGLSDWDDAIYESLANFNDVLSESLPWRHHYASWGGFTGSKITQGNRAIGWHFQEDAVAYVVFIKGADVTQAEVDTYVASLKKVFNQVVVEESLETFQAVLERPEVGVSSLFKAAVEMLILN